MALETGTTIANLNANWPAGTDWFAEGDDHLRLIKRIVKSDAMSLSGGGTVTGPVALPPETTVGGKTIAATVDLALKAPLDSPTFIGTPTAPTPLPGTNTTQLATTAFVKAEMSSGSGAGSGLTVDTNELYRLIMLSNGSVFAIPYAAVPPPAPTGVTATVRLTSVNLEWPIVPSAASFVIKRDGVQVATSVYQSYRDTTVIVGNTYTYTVSTVDQYRQRSPQSAPVTAYINPALNAAPADLAIRCWPLPIPTDGPAIIRVNAREIDTQTIAYALHVDAGSLTATSDPSVWVLRI